MSRGPEVSGGGGVEGNQIEPKKQQPLVWPPLTVPCPWAPVGVRLCLRSEVNSP